MDIDTASLVFEGGLLAFTLGMAAYVAWKQRRSKTNKH